jgi:hypothetical protein
MKARSVLRMAKLSTIVAAITIGVVACDRPDASRAAAADAGAPFDVETMAFLSEARALHHEANVAEDNGDLRSAIAAVDRIAHAKRPHADRAAPEIDEVLADAYARLAELDLRTGDSDGASRAANEGLAHARATTYFRGHLLEVEGVVEESRAASLADAGDGAGAARARSNAMRLLEEAVSVQERVIEAALDGGAVDGGAR